MVLCILVKFHENIYVGFRVMERTRMIKALTDRQTDRFNVQRAITPKVGKPELRLFCSAHRHMMLCILVKFHENIYVGFRVMERTRMIKVLTDRQTDGHSKFRRV